MPFRHIITDVMPKLFKIKNLTIRIWSNDHEPAHVHVVSSNQEIHFVVFLKNLSIKYKTIEQLSSKDEKLVIELIKNELKFIKEAWNEIHS